MKRGDEDAIEVPAQHLQNHVSRGLGTATTKKKIKKKASTQATVGFLEANPGNSPTATSIQTGTSSGQSRDRSRISPSGSSTRNLLSTAYSAGGGGSEDEDEDRMGGTQAAEAGEVLRARGGRSGTLAAHLFDPAASASASASAGAGAGGGGAMQL